MMTKKSRIIILIALLFITLIVLPAPGSAYKACRQTMFSVEGYGIWERQSTIFLLFYAIYDFDDGYNTATCAATGIGPFWHGEKVLETLVGCGLSIQEPCPRENFGVSP
jgi:hypothetical protein